jgi:hypothetical protein
VPAADAHTPAAEPFVRVFTIPAASPWDQDRAARLNAEAASPLPAPHAAIDVRRLELWSPGQPSRYCAGYLRKSQIKDELRIERFIEGRDVAFTFRSDALTREVRFQRLVDLVIAGMLVIALGLGLVKAINARSETRTALLSEEQSLRGDIARRQEAARDARVAVLLSGLAPEGRGGDDLMRDLSWLARSRRADVQIEDLVWNTGGIMVRTADDSNPIAASDHQVTQIATSEGVTWVVHAVPGTVATGSFHPSILSLPRPARR